MVVGKCFRIDYEEGKGTIVICVWQRLLRVMRYGVVLRVGTKVEGAGRVGSLVHGR